MTGLVDDDDGSDDNWLPNKHVPIDASASWWSDSHHRNTGHRAAVVARTGGNEAVDLINGKVRCRTLLRTHRCQFVKLPVAKALTSTARYGTDRSEADATAERKQQQQV